MGTIRFARPRAIFRGWGRLAVLGLGLSVGACYPGDGPTNVEDLDVVMTVHDEDVTFSSFQTYAMPDTVVHITGPEVGEGIDIIPLTREYDEMILDLAADNMAAAGYMREVDLEDALDADLVLLVGAIGTEKTQYWVGGGWWGWWGYYPGYPGYGWGWPPYYYGSTTLEQGTLMLTLLDPTGGEGQEGKVVWSGIVRGLLGYSGAQGRITESINQMFTQSPYLSQ